MADFMLSYVELRHVLERPDRRATPPMDFVTPVTADTSYLYAGCSETGRSTTPHSTASSLRRATHEVATRSRSAYSISPNVTRDHSPLSYGEAAPTAMTPCNNHLLYDDINIDPYLKYGDLATDIQDQDAGAFDRRTENILATDRSYHHAIYDGDLLYQGGTT